MICFQPTIGGYTIISPSSMADCYGTEKAEFLEYGMYQVLVGEIMTLEKANRRCPPMVRPCININRTIYMFSGYRLLFTT